MSIKDLTITDQNVQSTYVQSQPDRLTGTAQQNKAVFDAFPQLIRQRFNALLEALAGTGAAGEIPVGPIEGVTAENVQQALEAIQKNLTAYISKIKAETGAAEVGVSTISGMQAENVQKALEELRKAIDDSVSGIIPGGSITADMIQDGAITEDKLENSLAQKIDVLGGATTSQAALAALGAGVRPNIGDNCDFRTLINQRGVTSWKGDNGPDRWNVYGNTDAAIDTENGCIILNSDGSSTTGLRQFLEADRLKEGEVYTLSVLAELNGGSWYLSYGNNRGDIILNKELSDTNKMAVQSFEFTAMKSTDGFCNFRLRKSATAGSAKVYAMKLENGKGQTLGFMDAEGAWHYIQQPEKREERLIECQKYLWRTVKALNGYVSFPMGIAYSVSLLTVWIKLPCRMRGGINPTVTFSADEGSFKAWNTSDESYTDSTHVITDVTVSQFSEDYISLTLVTTGLTPGKMYQVQLRNGYIQISNEL